MESYHPEAKGAASPPVQDEGFCLASLSPAVRRVESIIAEVAPTSIPVLIVGESGSGKDLLAHRIHRLSRRGTEAFVKVICAEPGAESAWDADNGNGSKCTHGLEMAGTLFLDEVGELSLNAQEKLLSRLPEGSEQGQPQARLISATTPNLEEEIRAGRFREELYYRLNGVCLSLPPLRHRKEDIPGLVDFFLRRYSTQLGRPKPVLSSQALRAFLDHSWPGNVRELESTVKKIVVVGDERLVRVGAEVGTRVSRSQGIGERVSLKEAARAASRQAERELILRTLERTHWNRKRAAKELQISYKALLYKLKQTGLESSTNSYNLSNEQE